MPANIKSIEKTDEVRAKIRQMIFGPFRDEWRLPNGIVNATDNAISKRLNLRTEYVAKLAHIIVENHFEKVMAIRNKEHDWNYDFTVETGLKRHEDGIIVESIMNYTRDNLRKFKNHDKN